MKRVMGIACLGVAAALGLGHAVIGCSGNGSGNDAGDEGGMDGSSVDSGTCPTGSPCGDGGVCAGGSCCGALDVCGDSCCASGQLCSFQKCVTPGGPCVDDSDCAPGEYCEPSLGDAGVQSMDAGCMGGKPLPNGRCLPKPPICPPDGGTNDGGLSCLEKCEWKPGITMFDPMVKYSWGGQTTSPFSSDVMMTPIVVELDDDNCDGKVTADDIPEIVFSTFTGGAYYKQGTLHAISIVGGQVKDKWSKPNVVQPGGGLAAADLDGDGVAEIVGCMNPGPNGNSCCDALAQNTGVIAFHADGTQFWTQTDTTKVHCGYEAPAIGDVDNDGVPEVLVGLTLLDGKTGAVKKELDPQATWGARLSSLADLDGDGKLDVVDGQRAYTAAGAVLWDLTTGVDAIPRGYHAIGDFDLDGKPEVFVASPSNHRGYVVRRNSMKMSGADVVRRDVDLNNGISTATFCNAGSEYGGGPPTVADFDGDGTPDVGVAGAVGYAMLSGAKLMNSMFTNAQTLAWFKNTHDCSSAVTGSSVFDFNGDGKAEVIYSDEYHLWMYDGVTGTNLIPSTCNTTGTLWEYPLVADVDNDGQADIVIASNAYAITCPDNASKQSGIRVIQSASKSWVRSRRVWNEHTYHITNIGEDGRLPNPEVSNWTQKGLNNFRQNKQPGGEFSAPDAIVTLQVDCGGAYSLVATVRNIGQAVLPAGTTVKFYKDPPNGTLVGSAATTIPLGPAQAQLVSIGWPMPPADLVVTKVYATVEVALPTHECRTDNNQSKPIDGACPTVR